LDFGVGKVEEICWGFGREEFMGWEILELEIGR
jgi:hypothetical protein